MKFETHVKISKIIHVFLILQMIIYFLYTPYWGVAIELFSNVENFNLDQLWWPFLYVGIFFGIPLFFFCRLISPKKMRTKIIYPKTGYHPFYFKNYLKDEKRNMISKENIFGAVFFITIMILSINQKEDENLDKDSIIYFSIYLINFIYFLISFLRDLSISNAFSQIPLNIDNSLIIEVKYLNYLKDRNEGAMPYLQLGQRLECKTKDIPRSEKEENTVYVYNNNHPEKDYLITKIEDEGLCEIINKGNALHGELCSIEKYSKLHIRLWFEEENKIQS